MHKILLLLLSVSFVSCNSQTKLDRQKMFEDELSTSALKEYKSNSPFETSKFSMGSYNMQGYFNQFENSGVCLLFDLDSQLINELEIKIKSYRRLDNKSLKYIDSTYQFEYQSEDLKLPELPNWENPNFPQTPVDENVHIYLIKTGYFTDAFVNNSNTSNFRYIAGIYFLPKLSKAVYWFHIIKNKNRH